MSGQEQKTATAGLEHESVRKRYCLTLDLNDDPELIQQYREWHDRAKIWPEIPRGMKEVGILDMEIYLLGNRLFMIMETNSEFDFDEQMTKLSKLPRQKEWELLVARFQKPVLMSGPGDKWKMMERIFKLQDTRG